MPTMSTGNAGDARASTRSVETADSAGAETEVRGHGLGCLPGGSTEGAPERDRQDQRRRHDRSDCGRPHVCEKGGAGDALVMQHDQIREVRSGQEEGCGIRHEHGPVEERCFVDSTVPREMQKDRSEKEDRGVEVEHRGDDRDEPERCDEERPRWKRQLREPGACGSEQAVALGHDADEQQARDEGECRPGLRGSCAYAGQHNGRD